MSKNKNNKPVWSTRINQKAASTFQKVGSSLNVDKRLFREDITASIAHVEMLEKQKIITVAVKNKIIWGLKKILNEIIKKKFSFDERNEDIHMSIEKRLFEILGEDAGFIHTARSRNDQVLTDLKIWLRKSTYEIIDELNKTMKIFLKCAEKNIHTIMPGLTHLKNAQPISFGHYLVAYIEMFLRDKKRFKNNLENLYENPLGVAAFSGTSFNIDRFYTTKKLKFNKPTGNSIDTVSDRDFVCDFLYSVSLCSIHISRFSEEFIIWNSDAFNMISLNDKIVTGSSIMPQKRNPDPLEYLRGKSGSVIGNLLSMQTILKGLPLSYFKDLQDDKKLVFDSFDHLKNCLKILRDVLINFSPNKKRMLEFSEVGHTTATDLADYIVRDLKYPFRKAYSITAKIVNLAEKKKKRISEMSLDEIRSIDKKIGTEVLNVIKVNNSVKSKSSYGGTSFDNVKKMIKKYKKQIND